MIKRLSWLVALVVALSPARSDAGLCGCTAAAGYSDFFCNQWYQIQSVACSSQRLQCRDSAAQCNAQFAACMVSATANFKCCTNQSFTSYCGANPGDPACLACNLGGGGFPPICDPPRAHGIPQESAAEYDHSRPPGWDFEVDGMEYHVLEYRKPSMIPGLGGKEDYGVYFVTNPDTKEGRFAQTFDGMTTQLGRLLYKLSGKFPVTRAPGLGMPDVGLYEPLHRSEIIAKAGRWSIEWRDVPPSQRVYFPYAPYPRLLFDGNPATIHDLKNAGIHVYRSEDPHPY